MELNSQPIEKRVKQYNGTLDVHSIFYTIQGEGPFAGVPAVFVRLAGCNLQCPLCDTQYTQGRFDADTGWILDGVRAAAPDGFSGLVVVTGGEPFRQDLSELFLTLCASGYYLQVETNGTLPPSPFSYSRDIGARDGVYIVCSPKTGKVHEDIVARACCFKYVAQAGDIREQDGLPMTALGHTANPYLARPPAWWDRPVYLQPADEQDPERNEANTQAVVKSALKHGYTVQLQIHKFLGLE